MATFGITESLAEVVRIEANSAPWEGGGVTGGYSMSMKLISEMKFQF